MKSEKKGITYADLQKRVDHLISKFGVSKTVEIVDRFLGNTPLKKGQTPQTKVIVTFIVSESLRLFGCEGMDIEKENSTTFRDARKAAYHLIKKYTGLSYYQMGKYFGQSKRAVIYNYKNCQQRLSIPHCYKSFSETYTLLEEHLIQFIAKINE